MSSETIRITIPGEKNCDIHVGRGILPDLAKLVDLPRYSGAVILADENTMALFGETLRAALQQAGLAVQQFALPAGEAAVPAEFVDEVDPIE